MTKSNIVECRDICHSYDKRSILRNLNLIISQPGVYGFLGVNGAGKSTVLRILNGILQPTSGTVQVFGQKVGPNNLTIRHKIGYMPQDSPLYGWMTGQEFLVFCAALRKIPKRDAQDRIKELATRLSIEHILNERCKGYSGGERQRLSFAAALLGDPPLLLLDEPAAALDPIGRAQILELIAEFGKLKTVFFSTHIIDDIQRICQEVTILHDGRILTSQQTDKLLQGHSKSTAALSVIGEAKQFCLQLQQTPGIELTIQSQDEKLTSIELRCDHKDSCSQLLPSLLQQHQLGLHHFSWQQPSLEQIFVDLVKT